MMALHHSEDFSVEIKLKRSVFHTKTPLVVFALCCGLFKMSGVDRLNEGEPNMCSTVRAVWEELN